jgi:myosin heavy subunit
MPALLTMASVEADTARGEVRQDLIKTEAVLRLQAFHRGQLVRDLNRKLVENLASTSIQKMYRGFTCRLMMDKRRHQMMNKASVRIQSNWRGRKQRRRNEEERRADAACLIQAAWRGMKARQLVANMEYTLLAVPLELTVARASAYQDEEVRLPVGGGLCGACWCAIGLT